MRWGHPRDMFLVGDHNQGEVLGRHQPTEQIHDLKARLAIERAGGLVAQNQAWPIVQRPRNGHPLLLSTGQGGGPLIHLFAQPHLAKNLVGFFEGVAFPFFPAVEVAGQHDVLGTRQMVEQMEVLKHKSDFFIAKCAELAVGHLGQGLVLHLHRARPVPIEAPDDVQQRGLARTAGADDGYKLTRVDGKVRPSLRAWAWAFPRP